MATINPIDSSNPVEVAKGGTGNTTFTAYSVICGGTTTTGALQNVSGVGTSGQILTSNGSAALPTWNTLSNTGYLGYLFPNIITGYNYNTTAGIRWMCPFGNNNISATQTITQFVVPTAGTIGNLRINVTSNASTASVTVTVNKNSSNQTLQITISAGATGVFTDNTHTVSVAAGDLIQWEFSQATTGSLSCSNADSISCSFIAS